MGGYVGLAPAGFPNVALSNYAKEFPDDEIPLVFPLVCPNVPVERQSFPYLKWDRGNLILPGSTLRAPGDGATTIRRSYSTDTYMCRSHALKGKVPFEDEAYGLGLGFSTRQHMTGDLIGRIRRVHEAEVAALLLSLSNFPNGVDLTVGTNQQWDKYPAVPETGTDGSHPIAQINAYKELLHQAGVADNQMTLILSSPLVNTLNNHPDIVNRFKYTNITGIIDLDKLSSVFGVKCVRAGALSATQNMVDSYIWGSNAFLGYSKPSADRNDISCAKSFTWAGGKGPEGGGGNASLPAAPGTIDGFGVLEFLDPELDRKTYIQSVDWYYDTKVTAPETGVPILNALATPPVMGAIAGLIEG
jgi:hypothetical protein